MTSAERGVANKIVGQPQRAADVREAEMLTSVFAELERDLNRNCTARTGPKKGDNVADREIEGQANSDRERNP